MSKKPKYKPTKTSVPNTVKFYDILLYRTDMNCLGVTVSDLKLLTGTDKHYIRLKKYYDYSINLKSKKRTSWWISKNNWNHLFVVTYKKGKIKVNKRMTKKLFKLAGVKGKKLEKFEPIEL